MQKTVRCWLRWPEKIIYLQSNIFGWLLPEFYFSYTVSSSSDIEVAPPCPWIIPAHIQSDRPGCTFQLEKILFELHHWVQLAWCSYDAVTMRHWVSCIHSFKPFVGKFPCVIVFVQPNCGVIYAMALTQSIPGWWQDHLFFTWIMEVEPFKGWLLIFYEILNNLCNVFLVFNNHCVCVSTFYQQVLHQLTIRLRIFQIIMINWGVFPVYNN